MRVLVVDDKEEARYMLKVLLSGNGWEVLTAGNGLQALEILRTSAVDLIVSDILMPVMDGYQLCREVRADEALKGTPFVFYTATYTDREDEELAIGMGADRFIIKPAEPDAFIEAIKGVAGEARKLKHAYPQPAHDKEMEVLKLYNRRLVAKLEQKILDLKKAVDERRRAEEKFRSLIESYADHIFILSPEGVFIASNGRVGQFGLAAAGDVVGRGLEDLYDPETAAFYREKARLVTAGGEQVEFEHHLDQPDGRHWYSVILYPIRDGGGIAAVGGICKDITRRKMAEQSHRDSEERYRLLVESAGDAIFIVQDGFIRFPNPATESLTGYTVKELPGMKVFDLVHPEDRGMVQDRYVRRLKGETVPKEYLSRVVTRDGETKWVQMNVTLITWEGRPATLNFVRDMTEYRNLEEQMAQAQKMEAIGRLAGGVAHDFNNMLGAIIGFAEIARTRLGQNDPVAGNLEEILKAANRSKELTQRLLGLARKQTVKPEVLDLNSLIEDSSEMMRRLVGEDLEVRFVMGRDLWPVRIAPSQVDQITVNLLVNARDATAGAGTITIETRNVVLDDQYCSTHVGSIPGEYAMLVFSDSGHGMDPETLKQIFEPFFTTKGEGKGTGLGLSTVYGIVKQNDGFINVYSEPGEGTTFRIYIPRYRGPDVRRVEKSIKSPLSGTETILVVEDEEQILDICTEMLESLGYTVIAAGRPEDAIKRCERHEGEIHLLVTDMVMPVMDGKELEERIGSLKPGIRTLFMSGYTADVISHRGILDEGVHFIQKPFSMDELAGKVRDVLDE